MHLRLQDYLYHSPSPEIKREVDALMARPGGVRALQAVLRIMLDALPPGVYPERPAPQRPEVGPLMAEAAGGDGSVYLGYGTLEGKLLLVLPDFRALQPKASIKPSSQGAVYMTLRSIGAVGFNGRIEDQRPVRWRVTNQATGKQQTYMREADAMSEKARIVSMLQDELPAHLKDFVKVDPDTVTVEEVRE